MKLIIEIDFSEFSDKELLESKNRLTKTIRDAFYAKDTLSEILLLESKLAIVKEQRDRKNHPKRLDNYEP